MWISVFAIFLQRRCVVISSSSRISLSCNLRNSPGDQSQIFAKPETNWYKAEFGVLESLSLWGISREKPTRRYFGETFLWLVE